MIARIDGLFEKLLHLLMTSGDLSWFAHEHPEVRPDGSFELRLTLPTPGRYTLFHDFTPAGVGMQVVPVESKVPGPSLAPVALVPDADRPKVVDGYTARLSMNEPLAARRGSTLTISFQRDGEPVTDLEPFLDAMSHLMVVSEGGAHFVHPRPKRSPLPASHS